MSGNTTVIGAHRDDLASDKEGTGYVFVPGSSEWIEKAKLIASDGADRECFRGQGLHPHANSRI